MQLGQYNIMITSTKVCVGNITIQVKDDSYNVEYIYKYDPGNHFCDNTIFKQRQNFKFD